MKKHALIPMLIIVFSSAISYSAQERLTTHEIHYMPRGDGKGCVYFIKEASNENTDLWKFDMKKLGKITDDTLREYYFFDIFPDRSKLAVIKKDGKQDYIYVVNSNGSGQECVYSTGAFIDTVKVSNEGSKIAFVAHDRQDFNASAGTLCVMDYTQKKKGEPVVLASDVGIFGFRGTVPTREQVPYIFNLYFSQDSKTITFISATKEIVSVDIKRGTGARTSLYTSYINDYYRFRSGKCMLKFNDKMNDSLMQVSPDGKKQDVVYSTYVITCMAVSPDEKKTALVTLLKQGRGSISTGIVILKPDWSVAKEIPLEKEHYIGSVSWVASNIIACWDYGSKSGVCTDILLVDIDRKSVYNITKNARPVFNIDDAAANAIICNSNIKDYYVLKTNGEIPALLNLGGSQLMYGLSLSPDGKNILYSLFDDKEKEKINLFVKPLNGPGSGIKLDDNSVNNYFQYETKWSPDGRRILYYSPKTHRYYVVNADGSGLKQVVPDGGYACNFVFSPDGNELAFYGKISQQSGEYKIYATDFRKFRSLYYSYGGSYTPVDWKAGKVLIKVSQKICVVDSTGKGFKQTRLDAYNELKMSDDATLAAYTLIDNSRKEVNGLYLYDMKTTKKFKIADGVIYEFRWIPGTKGLAYIVNDLADGMSKVYFCDAASRFSHDLNPGVKMLVSGLGVLSKNKITYQGGLDIWLGDTTP